MICSSGFFQRKHLRTFALLKPCPENFWSREICSQKKMDGCRCSCSAVHTNMIYTYVYICKYILSILGLEDWENCYFCSLLMFLRKGRWLVDIVHLLSFSPAKGFCKAFFVDLLLTDSIGQTTCVQSAVSKTLVVVDSYNHPINALSQSDITIEQFESCLVNTMKNPQICFC